MARRAAGAVVRLVAFVAVWLATALLVGAASAAFAQVSVADDPVVRGGGVYQNNCAACHGTAGLGGVGHGRERAPSLRDLPLAYFDQTLRTGRMPIADPSVGVFRDQLDDEEREALLAYAAAELGADGELPSVGAGDAARGQLTYVRNCAACHGATTSGGVVGGGTTAPALTPRDPVAVAEAIRVGPFEMPAFEAEALDDEQVDDVIAYLQEVETSPTTALGLREVNDVIAAGAALVLTATVLLVLARLGRRDGGSDTDPDTGNGGWT